MLKKMVVMLLTLVMLGSVFTGCAKSEKEDTNDGSGTKGDEKVTISFFHWRNEDKTSYEKVIDMFEEKNPNINVEMEIIPTNDYYTTLTMRVFGGESGDVFAVHPGGELINIANAGAYMDLSDQSDILSHFDDDGLAAGQVDGKQYALVQTTNPTAMYYNKTMFAENNLEVPTTWEDFLNVCETLKNAGITPINYSVGELWVPQLFFISLMANVEEDPFIMESVEAGDKKISDIPSIKATLEMLVKLRDSGYFQDNITGTKYDAMVGAFGQEQAAMIPTGTWSMSTVRDLNPDIDFGVFNIPAQGGTAVRGVNVPGLLLGVNAETKHKEASLKFAEYMCSPEAMNIISNETGQLTVVKDVNYDNEDLKTAEELLNGDDGYYALMFHQVSSQNQDVMSNLIVEVLSNPGADLDQLMEKWQKEIDKNLAANK
ncbi:hypothetical protein SH1V18_07860 [Vallitalea longa]|uniref:Uncharacterized protein n=1 Tax=Vallitalea longa TaxID=2936439 RepID=A0A9W6DD73_9FIRM|nr:extracellular solute-binding protein [Vallitalea longa]GKX28306.1 hypothetical protein SH1V18_07860 [Vallitalea longa]